MSELHEETMRRLAKENKPMDAKEDYLFSENKNKSSGVPVSDIRRMLNEMIEKDSPPIPIEASVTEASESVEQEPVIINEAPPLIEAASVALKSDLFELNGIEAFLDWIDKDRGKFTEMQLSAFSALESARAVIYHGCTCQEGRRRNRANDYFKFFLEANKDTDLVEAIKKAANTDLLILSNHLGEITRL